MTMTRDRRWLRNGSLAVAVALVLGLAGSSAGGQAPDEREALIARQEALIREQQILIANQESLLNAYRCRFFIDTHLVPNGCRRPAQPTPTATATPTPTATAVPTPAPTPGPAPAIPAGTTEEQWEQLRQCNANGNYQHINLNGIHFGAYEFRQSSWDELARRHYPHLAGVKPNEAAPVDQDRMAYRLYEEQGRAPWPTCGASLPAPSPTPSPTPGELPPIPAGTTQAQWDHLIQCESHGNYRAENPRGPYLGAFQFLQSTWNGVAQRNYPNLVGVDPRDAAPADQHRMAYALYEESGWRPWPACTEDFR